MQVKSPSQIAEKWSRVTPQRQDDYIQGVNNPRKDWQEQTTKAEPAYIQGVQQSLTNKSWSKGVARAGTAKWKAGATVKGPSRWAQGVSEAKTKYQEGFAPFHQTLQALQLPQRGAKGDPKNIQRVSVVADAMHKTKLSLTK